jgi:phospholipase C
VSDCTPRNRRANTILAIAAITAVGIPTFAQNNETRHRTTTPIRHVVVIFDENVSFDHYFATYPRAANPEGEPMFNGSPNTPAVNGLSAGLLTHNPNSVQPFRLDRSQAATCDQGHDYTPEQQAFDSGLMDKFPQFTGSGTGCDPGQVMGYFDGNTVTALWNYAQHFALADNFFGTTFGPSTPGAINLASGQTHGVDLAHIRGDISGGVVDGTMIGDPDPYYDDCSDPSSAQVSFTGRNIGDLLNAKGITWGWFEGGFKPTTRVKGAAVCGASHTGLAGSSQDYVPHHEPFQYYASTANPRHLPPTSVAMIGRTDQANHQYDLSDFWHAVESDHLPAVSFLKAAAYQDGHAGYSDPLDEQHFLVEAINRLQKLDEWKSTAVIIAWDDSDGWYDHVMGPILNQSNVPGVDALTGPGSCGVAAKGAYQARCGYGPRLPLLAISPFARVNSVDHAVTDQTSILRFIEDNWKLGRIGDQSFDEWAGPLFGLFDFQCGERARRLFLDPETGEERAKD